MPPKTDSSQLSIQWNEPTFVRTCI